MHDPKCQVAPDSPAGRILALGGPQNTKVEKAISILKKSNNEVIEDTISRIAKVSGTKERVPEGRHFLNWDEVREMRHTRLVSFGSHTVNHAILTNLDQNEARCELVKSKEKLLAEGAVDSTFIPFCYPNEDFTPAIASQVQEVGYSAALTTKKGWNSGCIMPFALSRISVHQDISSTTPLFRCRIAGIF